MDLCRTPESLMKQGRIEPNTAGEDKFVGGGRLRCSVGGQAAFVRLRCATANYGREASRSLGEGWWRWRESNPRPKDFSW